MRKREPKVRRDKAADVIKVLEFFNRRTDLPQEDFLRYWRGRHTSVVMGITGIRRYVQNPVRHDLLAGLPFDGIVEVWFSGLEMMRANAKSPYWPEVEADEARFINRDSARLLLIDDPAPSPVTAGLRLFVLLNAAEAAEAAAFDEALASVAALPGARIERPFQRRREVPLADAVLSIAAAEDHVHQLIASRPWAGFDPIVPTGMLLTECRPILIE